MVWCGYVSGVCICVTCLTGTCACKMGVSSMIAARSGHELDKQKEKTAPLGAFKLVKLSTGRERASENECSSCRSAAAVAPDSLGLLSVVLAAT